MGKTKDNQDYYEKATSCVSDIETSIDELNALSATVGTKRSPRQIQEVRLAIAALELAVEHLMKVEPQTKEVRT